MLSVAVALNVLHGNRIAHLDLRSPNILLDANGETKVADVGLSKIMRAAESLVSLPGTIAYSAPEQLQGRAGTPADIWSFGVLLFEVGCLNEWTVSQVAASKACQAYCTL